MTPPLVALQATYRESYPGNQSRLQYVFIISHNIVKTLRHMPAAEGLEGSVGARTHVHKHTDTHTYIYMQLQYDYIEPYTHLRMSSNTFRHNNTQKHKCTQTN